MLRKLSINNYKLFDRFHLELSDGINLICGPNGSGKTSLCDVLYALTGFLAMSDVSNQVNIAVTEAFPFAVFCRWQLQDEGYGDIKICMEVDDSRPSSDGKWFAYDLLVRYNFKERLIRVQEEKLDVVANGHTQNIITFIEGHIKIQTDNRKTLSFNGDWSISALTIGSRNNSKIREFGKLVANIMAFHALPHEMKSTFKIAPAVKQMGRWGETFPAWRSSFSREYPEKQNDVLQECKNFIPGLVSIAELPVGNDSLQLTARVAYNGNSYPLTFEELSDGQKKLLAMYSLLTHITPYSTILIDEPENYLAPSELQPWLNAMHNAWEDRGIQFIIISHNPQTLNWHHKEAYIFEVIGTPPRIVCCKNDGEKPLIEKLAEMEWAES